jgi:hypothetical protein
MAGLGNPLSFALGGGPSPQEAVYAALVNAVGTGNVTPGDFQASVMESWRFAKARGLAASVDDARAVAQNFPDLATDMIPMFEQLLDIGFPADTSDEQKRSELTTAYTREINAAIPAIEVLLQEIEPGVTIVIPDHDLLRETQLGRMFQDWDPSNPDASGPPFNLNTGNSGDQATGFPNYSDDFIFLVLFPLPPGTPPTEAQLRSFEQIRILMNEAMPSWCNLTIFAFGSGIGQPCGFVLDQDLLDLTVFCS